MGSLFPLISAPTETTAATTSATGTLYREVKWDFTANRPVWRNGSPVWVTGAEAVASWVANALWTERGSRDLFTTDYGLELRALAGQPFTDAVKQSEAIRYVKECLEINPYITGVRQVEVSFAGDTLAVKCAVDTVYGEVSVDVDGL